MATVIAAAALSVVGTSAVQASDHLDSPAVIADPRADIGDLYAWTSSDGRQLNLAMTIVGHTFSDKLRYVFHVDSGSRFGKTTVTTSISCRFDAANVVDCAAGHADRARGDASDTHGLEGKNHRFRVFAGLRDDPFFNNVKGSRDAFQAASFALLDGVELDPAGCARFDAATSQMILDRWQHTDGGKGSNFLAGWTPASIVVSIDLDVVDRGGKLLAVWGETSSAQRQIDRAGRPLTGNALLAPLAPAAVSDALKDRYNQATPATAASFIPRIQETLGLYDGYDGQCGNQLLADHAAEPALRYRRLATLLADDRLWVNSASKTCAQFFAVELAQVAGQSALGADCGGRTPNYDAVDVYRSLLANGTTTGVSDGVDRDEREHSTSAFPFLAPPDAAPAGKY
jgi:hypothetical protein